MNDQPTSNHSDRSSTAVPTPGSNHRKRNRAWIGAALAVASIAAVGCSAVTHEGSDVETTALDAPADFARTFDVGDGRQMYMECAGQGSPTVILVSGGGIAGDVWDSPLGERPTVFPTIERETRVCSYDRPGATLARAEGGISRSDPVPQPVTPAQSADDLQSLLDASGEVGPYVLAAHSYGGLVARYFANQHPDEVSGMVLVDSFSPELRDAMGEQWPDWIVGNTTPPEVIADYPDYERVDFDVALDQVRDNSEIAAMPMVVLTADAPYPPSTQPGAPADLHLVIRAAQDVSQVQVADLVPGAEHITDTDSGHDIMLENPEVVSDSILDVIAAVRAGRTTLFDDASGPLDEQSTAALDSAFDEGFADSGAAGATVGLWIPGTASGSRPEASPITLPANG